MKNIFKLTVLILIYVFISGIANAATLTFETELPEAMSHSFDIDNDSIMDIQISSINTSGAENMIEVSDYLEPGYNGTYVNEMFLGGDLSRSPNSELRIDFLNGLSTGFLSFGFIYEYADIGTGINVVIYNSSNNIIWNGSSIATPINLTNPEGIITASFTGIASYAIIDFLGVPTTDWSGYGIDNLSTTNTVPIPSTLSLFIAGLFGLAGVNRRKK